MRSVTGTSLVVGALAATLLAILLPIWSFPGGTTPAGVSVPDDGQGTVNTEFGPLTPLDRDFTRKVRLAGLWEGPAGQQAQTKSTNAAVKDAGQHLIDGHAELDERTLKVASALNIDLPTRPSDQQQEWLDMMTAAQSGPEYERLWANLLRRAHGKVFGLIAEVRANTRNSMVRAYADRVNAVVLDHITVLEKTGYVDFDSLQDTAPPSGGAPTAPPTTGSVNLPPANSSGGNPPAGAKVPPTSNTDKQGDGPKVPPTTGSG